MLVYTETKGICKHIESYGHKKTGYKGRFIYILGLLGCFRMLPKRDIWSGRRESNPRHELGKLR